MLKPKVEGPPGPDEKGIFEDLLERVKRIEEHLGLTS
jgi:hypothetical protein